jgi:hypothetical protein
MDYGKMAKGLGWFSIAIGLTELVATKPLARALRMEDRKGLLRVFGIREIAAGVGILSQARRGPWLWARVGGDLLDMATLGRSVTNSTEKTGPLLAAAAVAGVTALDVACGRRLSEQGS